MAVQLPPWLPRAAAPAGVCEHGRSKGGPIPSRYDHIDLRATKAMQKEAAIAIDLRRKLRRGGLRKGRNMARRIVSGQRIHPDNVRDMFAFFSRFKAQADAQRGTPKWDYRSDEVSNLRIAWKLWGGDPGHAWSRARRRQLDAADREAEAKSLTPWIARSEGERATYWRQWLDRVQGPTERRIRAQWRRGRRGMFPEQARRYSERVGAVLGGQRSAAVLRDITREQMDAILMNELEREILLDEFDREIIDDALRLAFGATARRLRVDLVWDPTTDITEQIIGDMIVNVQQYTKDRVAAIVRAGTTSGASINEIQRTLIRDPGFSPMRALRIARTESVRTISEATNNAYISATVKGVEFEIEWVNSADDEVRPSHRAKRRGGIGGTRVAPGDPFVLPTGESALGPGLFGVAAQDINCRCTTRPVNVRG